LKLAIKSWFKPEILFVSGRPALYPSGQAAPSSVSGTTKATTSTHLLPAVDGCKMGAFFMHPRLIKPDQVTAIYDHTSNPSNAAASA
jgi:hypothetical protein